MGNDKNMTVSTTMQANVKWAERDDKVWVTVQHASPEDVQTDISENNLKCTFKTKDQEYHFSLDFFKEIKKDDAKMSDLSSSRLLEFCFPKAEEGSWGKLSAKKQSWISLDWDKWYDSDAEDEPSAGPGGGAGGDFDMSGMQGMGGGGMPGMGGMGGMPGMGGMGGGGMPGMGGMGGMGGMDMEAMMKSMGGMAGMGGGEGGMPDFSNLNLDALKEQMGKGAGKGGEGDSDDDLPDLEDDAEKVD